MRQIRFQLNVIVLLNSIFAFAQEEWVAPVARRSLPSVVTVLSFDGAGKQFGLGSGFIVREDGLVVTNYHVIQNASAVEVRGKAIGSFRVNGVVAVDRGMDFAVLKITVEDLPVIPLGDSSLVKLGEGVVAIGNPKGLTGTVSAGLISQIREEGDLSILQTSAPIYSGNSGGPLINKRGEVIGVITARVGDGPTLGLALPINYVRRALQNNTSIKYTIGEVARLEAIISKEERINRIRDADPGEFRALQRPGGIVQSRRSEELARAARSILEQRPHDTLLHDGDHAGRRQVGAVARLCLRGHAHTVPIAAPGQRLYKPGNRAMEKQRGARPCESQPRLRAH